MGKLSKAQEKALKKLTHEWQGSYALQVGRNTLDALERKGLAVRRSDPGSLFMPSIHIKYRLAEKNQERSGE